MSFPEQSRPSHDAIARRAYELFLERGGQAGDPSHDWLRAEAELAARTTADRKDTRQPASAEPPAASRKASSPRRRAAAKSAAASPPRSANGKGPSTADGPSAPARPRRAEASSRSKRA